MQISALFCFLCLVFPAQIRGRKKCVDAATQQKSNTNNKLHTHRLAPPRGEDPTRKEFIFLAEYALLLKGCCSFNDV